MIEANLVFDLDALTVYFDDSGLTDHLHSDEFTDSQSINLLKREMTFNDGLYHPIIDVDNIATFIHQKFDNRSNATINFESPSVGSNYRLKDIVFLGGFRTSSSIIENGLLVDAIMSNVPLEEFYSLYGLMYSMANGYTQREYHKHFFITYLIGSRMDRVCEEGGALSLSVVIDMTLSGILRRFDTISILEPHSLVGFDTLFLKSKKLKLRQLLFSVTPSDRLFETYLGILEELDDSGKKIILVAPDNGAVPRVRDFISRLKNNRNKSNTVYNKHEYEFISCEKIRNPSTGEINGLELTQESNKVVSSNPDATYVILDDLCDGGGTFTRVAETIRFATGEETNIVLCVTHAIFPHGHIPPVGVDYMITTNSYSRNVGDKLKVIALSNESGSMREFPLSLEQMTYKIP